MINKKEFVDFLIESNALKFGDFITKSGRHSPYFINIGMFQTGEQMKRLGKYYADNIISLMEQGFLHKDLKVLFGPAYKGIPLVTATSIALADRGIDLKYCFNRKEVKDHGEGGNMVGYDPQPGDKVLIIEDVITAGTAVREVLPLLTERDVEVCGLMVSVDRMEKGRDETVKTWPIITLEDILKELQNDIPVEIKRQIEDYMSKYCVYQLE